MQCCIFSQRNPLEICGEPATNYIPLAIGQNARMHDVDDALFCGYIPVCTRHTEMTPAHVRVFKAYELTGVMMKVSDIDG